MLELRYAFRAHHVQMALAKLEVIRAMLPQSMVDLHRGLDKFFPVHLASDSSVIKEQQRSREMQMERWRNSLPQKRLQPQRPDVSSQPLPIDRTLPQQQQQQQHRIAQPSQANQHVPPTRPTGPKVPTITPISRSRQYTHPVLHSIHSHVMLQQNSFSAQTAVSARNTLTQQSSSSSSNERMPMSSPLNIIGAQISAKISKAASSIPHSPVIVDLSPSGNASPNLHKGTASNPIEANQNLSPPLGPEYGQECKESQNTPDPPAATTIMTDISESSSDAITAAEDSKIDPKFLENSFCKANPVEDNDSREDEKSAGAVNSVNIMTTLKEFEVLTASKELIPENNSIEMDTVASYSGNDDTSVADEYGGIAVSLPAQEALQESEIGFDDDDSLAKLNDSTYPSRILRSQIAKKS